MMEFIANDGIIGFRIAIMHPPPLLSAVINVKRERERERGGGNWCEKAAIDIMRLSKRVRDNN